MKRIATLAVSVIMVLSMLLSMAGCTSEQSKFIGTWEAEMKLDEVLNTVLGANESLEGLVELKDISLTTQTTFNEDGTYKTVAVEESVEEMGEKIIDAVLDGTLKALQNAVAAQGVEMTVEEILAAQGTTKEAMRKEFADSLDVDSMVENFVSEGEYKVEDGKLYMSDENTTLDEAVENGKYETYEIDGDTLKLTGAFGDRSLDLEDVSDEVKEAAEKAMHNLYPVTYTKVK